MIETAKKSVLRDTGISFSGTADKAKPHCPHEKQEILNMVW